MPCSSGMTESAVASSMAQDAKREADKVTRMLCALLRVLPPECMDADPELRAWYEKHKSHDKQEGR